MSNREQEVVDLISRMVEKDYLRVELNENDEMVFNFGLEPPPEDKQLHRFWNFLLAYKEAINGP